MGAVYAGSTPKYLIKIKDENGVQLDPSDIAVVSEVKVFLYNSFTGTVIGKFYLNTEPEVTGWTQMTVKELSASDKRLLMVLTAAMTQAAEGNSNEIQINTHIVDTDAPSNTRIVIKKGKFHEIKPAKS